MEKSDLLYNSDHVEKLEWALRCLLYLSYSVPRIETIISVCYEVHVILFCPSIQDKLYTTHLGIVEK